MKERGRKEEMAENEVKKADVKPDRSDKESRGIGGWFSDIKGEFKKIFWPTKKELVSNAITVVITSAVIAVIVFAMDIAFGFAYSTILDFASNFRL
jgi:preprotein translocase subunit SecE